MDFTVNLVGAGNMGGAMLRGWVASGFDPENLAIIDPAPPEAMLAFLKENAIHHAASAADADAADILLLAVKPQMMEKVLPQVVSVCGDSTVVVSVAAGTGISTIANALGERPIVRCMPNTPSLVGRGMTVGCANEKVSDLQKGRISLLLKAIGKFEWVEDEALIDAVTAVSGSGPAYVFHLAECMAKAGEAAGLPPELAMTLARETVAGAGELLFHASESAGQLRKNVTSPGGTTQAALEVLMGDDAMEKLLTEAVAMAQKRSRELS